MKVFVAGATGVLGRATIPKLLAAGHEVVGVARSSEKAELLRRLGAQPVEVDLFDVEALKAALAGCDVAVHMATHIPPIEHAWRLAAWAENDRLRREGTPILIEAARAAGVRRIIKESVVFGYPDRGEEWIDEDVPPVGERFLGPTLDAERATLDAATHGIDGVVLRFGLFYGPECRSIDEQLSAIRSGMSPLMGSPEAYQPSIHIDDAADAVVASLAAPPGLYNVADEPITKSEWVDAFKDAFGITRHVRFAPALATKALGQKVDILMRSQRVSSARFREATGWRPAHRSAVEGLAATAVDRRAGVVDPNARPERVTGIAAVLVRAVLLYLAFSQALVGVWATFFPRSFYDDFPGWGLDWVSVDGPYNQHLVRDTGAWSLGMTVLAIVAAISMHRMTVAAAGLAIAVATVPHVIYHARHTGVFDSTADALPSVISLATIAVVALLLFVWAVRQPAQS